MENEEKVSFILNTKIEPDKIVRFKCALLVRGQTISDWVEEQINVLIMEA